MSDEQRDWAQSVINRWLTTPDVKHTNKIEQDILQVLKLLVAAIPAPNPINERKEQ